ncbi:hypothetical protein [Ulvibacterium sp.]|uniref:hypothetical protein n=1 Tax=Ulvibacterium sp. TaxID=2665914 RepID=UPI002619514E|nr:hypothetical protein [Ulvibacterium sp.]
MIRLVPFLCIVFFSSCSNYGQLTFIAELPKKLDENSGIAMFSETTLWLIEDSGNPDEIYQVDLKGNLLKKLKVKNAKNKDWEDLTKDKKGNLYIGDFGNNSNDRKDLVIYKLPNPEIEPGDKIDALPIRFSYPEQKRFPPKKARLYYDAEAFFHHGNFLYIITKNRARPFSGKALLYRIPDYPGQHKALFMGSFRTCDDWKTCQITSVDISPDERTIVLLSYGKLWKVTHFRDDKFLQGTSKEIDLGARSQLEAVCFMNDSTLLISDEKRGTTGRNLYSFPLK